VGPLFAKGVPSEERREEREIDGEKGERKREIEGEGESEKNNIILLT